MEIKRADKQDIERLVCIEAGHSGYACWGRAGFENEFEKNFSVTLKAVFDNEIFGFVNFWIIRPSLEINTLVVDKNSLRKKVGEKLLDKCFQYALKNDCSKIILDVAENNEPAKKLYQKKGFREISRRSKYYNNLYDAIVMESEVL